MDFQDSSMGMDSTTQSEALRIDSVSLESKIHQNGIVRAEQGIA